jgi:hypothetical protein
MRFLLNPGTYVGAALALLLAVAAYQVRPSYDIAFGSATDGPLLRGFNAGEQAEGTQGLEFRWSTGDASITLQDVGRQDFDVTLQVSGSRPAGQPPRHMEVSAGGTRLLVADPPPAITDYSFRVPREAVPDGTLEMHITSNAFSPPGDPRELGVIVTRLRVSPANTPDLLVEPPLGPSLSLAGAAGLLGLLLAALGWGPGGVALGSSLVGSLGAWLLVADRLWLTTGRWYQTWPLALFAGALLVLGVYLVGGWLLRLAGAPWSPLQRRALLTLMLIAFGVRLAGQLHPQIFIVDLLFHAHRFETVRSGQLLFTIESAEWGGRSTFYLPTPYVLMLPLQWLLNDELLVIKLFTVAFSTLGGFLLFYVARRSLGGGPAGLVAAALYLAVPIAVLPFSWGITSNVFGEFFALCALAVLVTSYRNLLPSRPSLWMLVLALLVALLSHPGVVQLAAVAVGLISLLWLASGRIIGGRGPGAWALAALVVAVGLAYLLYYRHFAAGMIETLREIQAERAAQAAPGALHLKIGGSVADRSLGLVVRFVDTRWEWLTGGLRGFWQEAQAYYRVWPVAGALLGYLLIWPARARIRLKGQGRAMLVLAAAGWLLSVALFAIVGWTVNLYVRYALFALPVLALGAGILLAGVWRRGPLGAAITLMLLAFYVAEALALWQYRITYAFK